MSEPKSSGIGSMNYCCVFLDSLHNFILILHDPLFVFTYPNPVHSFFYVKILEKVDMQNVKAMGNDGIY